MKIESDKKSFKIKDLVSVIMPAYNSEKYIGEAIQSVLGQTYSDWELLIVDDCSTDKTMDIIRQFAAKDSRIKVYKFDEPSGRPAVPRNFAISNSRGKFIAFLDSDDVWTPDKLEDQLKYFKDQSVVAVCSPARLLQNYNLTQEIPREWQCRKIDVESILLKNPIVNSSVVVKKAAYRLAGELDESPEIKFSEDWDLWIRLASLGKIVNTNTPHVKYRIHNSNCGRSLSQYKRDISVIEKNSLQIPKKILKRAKSELYYRYGRLYFNEGDIHEARKLFIRTMLLAALPLQAYLKCIIKLIISCLPKFLRSYFLIMIL